MRLGLTGLTGGVAIAALTAIAPANAVSVAPELHIYPSGEVHLIAAELSNRHALNLLSVTVWGLKWTVEVEQYTKVESADGKPVTLSDITVGHALEVRGRPRISIRDLSVDARLVRDLSIGTPSPPTPPPPPPPPALSPSPPPAPPPAAPEQASVSAALAPPPAPMPTPVPSGRRLLTQNIKPGMRGGEVITLQEFLQKNGWGIPNDGPVTGNYGKVTVNAVKKFQVANGLPPEGEVGPKTRAAINKLLGR